MSTIAKLVSSGDIHSLTESFLDDDEQPLRYLYATTRAKFILEDTFLNNLATYKGKTLATSEQLYQLFHEYCIGHRLYYEFGCPGINSLSTTTNGKETRDGIWELKSKDVRIFGFFPHKDTFIITRVFLTAPLKNGDIQYSGLIEESSYDISQLNLKEPKFIPGEDPENVISNYSRSQT